MDKVIVTALMVIAGVISAIFVFNSIYPAITQSGSAMASMERRIDDRMKTQIAIINAAKPGDTVVIWVKNVGNLRIEPPESSDVFFGLQGNYARIPYNDGSNPSWTWTLENDTDWNPTATLKITITYTSNPPGAGTYFTKVILPNGIADESFFSW